MDMTSAILSRYLPLGAVGAAGAVAVWQGTSVPGVLEVLIVTFVVVLLVWLVVSVRRALRQASDRIDTILREELDRARDRDLI